MESPEAEAVVSEPVPEAEAEVTNVEPEAEAAKLPCCEHNVPLMLVEKGLCRFCDVQTNPQVTIGDVTYNRVIAPSGGITLKRAIPVVKGKHERKIYKRLRRKNLGYLRRAKLA